MKTQNLIEISQHGKTRVITAGGRWLVNQAGDFSQMQADKVNAEHAALLAVAEAAQPALEELSDLSENGLEAPSTVVQVDLATLVSLREALANLAAIREGK